MLIFVLINLTVNDAALRRLDHIAMNAASLPQDCLEKTREDIWTAIFDWVQHSSGPENVFWLHAPMGYGKTTLASTVAGYLRELRRLGAFLFFDRRSDPSAVIRTIAYQLGSFDPRIASEISKALTEHAGIEGGQLQSQFDYLLRNPLTSLARLGPQGAVVVMLDGLDECGTVKQREVLLELLARDTAKLPHFVRFIVTSQAHLDIQTFFGDKKHVLPFELDITTEANQQDILAYIRHRMGLISKRNALLSLRSNWPGEEHVQALAERSHGVFGWLNAVIDYVDGHDPEELLTGLLTDSESLAKAEAVLDARYLDMLQSDGLIGDPAFRSDFRAVMGAIIVSRNRLSDGAIDQLLQLKHRPSFHTIKRFRAVLRCKSKAPAESPMPVCLFHPSFGEFITNQHRCGSDWFIDLKLHTSNVTSYCLTLLESIDPSTTPFPEEVSYACEYWIPHLCSIPDGQVLFRDRLEPILQNRVQDWLSVMRLQGQLPTAILHLKELQRVCHFFCAGWALEMYGLFTALSP
jgi:hypothetical protein